jgi:hypothetical protein
MRISWDVLQVWGLVEGVGYVSSVLAGGS